MAITCRCSKCGQQFEVDPAMAGKKGKCPGCSAIMTLPGVTPKAPQVAHAVAAPSATTTQPPTISLETASLASSTRRIEKSLAAIERSARFTTLWTGLLAFFFVIAPLIGAVIAFFLMLAGLITLGEFAATQQN